METSGKLSESFFSEETRLLNDLAEGSNFTFKRGNVWAINPDNGEATFDPKFFEDRGYTQAQSLFATLHELRCHLVEVKKIIDQPGGIDAYLRFKERAGQKQRIHIWENCRTDIKGNTEIMRFAPALTPDARRLYKEKLWPETDFTEQPKHLQFMYAILRQNMVPDESVTIDPKVQEAIDKLRNVRGKDVVALSTDPCQNPLFALMLSEKYIEPVIEELYEEDLKNKNHQGKGQNNNQEAFANDYQDYEKRHPEPMEDGGMEEKIKAMSESQSDASRYNAGYEQEYGVNMREVADYFSEYQKVGQYIEPLRQIFHRIVEQRKTPVRRLAALKEEGIMVDPGLVAQTYLDIQSGIQHPKTMKDFEGSFIEENIPGKFLVRLVADQSTSMDGEKAVVQRRSAIVVMEALKEFSDLLDEERPGLKVDLDVQTELSSFGVNEGIRLYKPLSNELTEQQRINYFKGLLETPGETNDYDALAAIELDIQEKTTSEPTYMEELRSGKRRELVIVLSDGKSSDEDRLNRRLQNLRGLGVKVVGLGMTEDSGAVQKAYAPDGRICYDISDLPKSLQDTLVEFLGELSTTGKSSDIIES